MSLHKSMQWKPKGQALHEDGEEPTQHSGQEVIAAGDNPDRSTRHDRNCSIRRTVEIILDRWTFLIIREAFFGIREFERFQQRLGVPRQTLSARLKRLVENEIFRTVAKPDGRGNQYRFTERGKDLFPVMLSMIEFGDKWLTDGSPTPMVLYHHNCNHECHPTTVCSVCREPIDARDVSQREGPGAGFSQNENRPTNRRSPDALLEQIRPSSVGRTLEIIGDRWSFLVIREGFLGVRRFDELSERLGISSNILAERLARLVDTGVLRKERTPGGFSEYRFTEMGRDLFRPMLAMMRWGDTWLSDGKVPQRVRHRTCDCDFHALVVCDHCGEPIASNATRYELRYELTS
ncbi:winged helix-turn-helix transcriptional regulator [Mesorhizobium australicum]|nr:helix-turn-helix domain-containing protein [Mesorhizobium australicum]